MAKENWVIRFFNVRQGEVIRHQSQIQEIDLTDKESTDRVVKKFLISLCSNNEDVFDYVKSLRKDNLFVTLHKMIDGVLCETEVEVIQMPTVDLLIEFIDTTNRSSRRRTMFG